MSTELVLFLLRLISGALLIAVLVLLFVFMWRDYHTAATQAEASRRVYGRLTSLIEVDGTYAVTGQSYPLLPITSMGRAPTNTIPIDDSFASSEHAVIAMRNGQWWLEDRKSRNGTTLNGMPVTQSVIVTDGDIIGIGKMRFRLDLEH
ncbi:MAG TPA: FHA domain-containing protein [Oceanobacillus sp.]|nr:FHA domain-containing protein [Oceanobacillus sp.]